MTKKDEILNLFKKNPKELFSLRDINLELKYGLTPPDIKQTENVIRNFRMIKVILRHKDKDVNNDFQYAMEMKSSDISVWVLNQTISNKQTGKSYKRKGNLLSKKEIQSMFAAQYNTLAKLEDEVMRVVDNHEEISKEMQRIRNALGK